MGGRRTELTPLPELLCRTVTFDNGKKFIKHKPLAAAPVRVNEPEHPFSAQIDASPEVRMIRRKWRIVDSQIEQPILLIGFYRCNFRRVPERVYALGRL